MVKSEKIYFEGEAKNVFKLTFSLSMKGKGFQKRKNE